MEERDSLTELVIGDDLFATERHTDGFAAQFSGADAETGNTTFCDVMLCVTLCSL